MMKLYLLERIGSTDYDQTAGMVIAAVSAPSARRIADSVEFVEYYGNATEYPDEFGYSPDSYNLWDNPKRSKITCLGRATSGAGSRLKEGIILRDFRAG